MSFLSATMRSAFEKEHARAKAGSMNTSVLMKTNKGDITIELDDAKAPISVKNFLAYVDSGYFNGTIFHRVIPGFMIQGGGIEPSMKDKPSRLAPIKNEATNGLKNKVGTLAMARTSQVDSATSQFFINVADNAFLDHRSADANGFGYAVFGRVSAGMDVVHSIEKVKTRSQNGHDDVPVEPILIESVTRL